MQRAESQIEVMSSFKYTRQYTSIRYDEIQFKAYYFEFINRRLVKFMPSSFPKDKM